MNHGQYLESYDALLTIGNNNYFSMKMNKIGIRLYYKSWLIGYRYPNQTLYLPSHSNVDILSQMTVISSQSQMNQMYHSWINDSMSIKIEMTGTAKTYFLNTNFGLYSITIDLEINDFKQGKSDQINQQCICSV